MAEPCRIIGVLDNGKQGLTPAALEYIQTAELVIGGTRTLALFADLIKHAESRDFTFLLTQVPGWISEAVKHQQKVVVLATGDPLCHGIAGFLIKKLGVEALDIIPNVSSIQQACAEFGLSWQDARIVSIHNQDAGEWRVGADQRHGLYTLRQAICQHDKLIVLTSPDNTPDCIARLLLLENLADRFDMFIAEDLFRPEQRIIQGSSVDQIAQQTFNGNDVVILLRKQKAQTEVLFGLADDRFHQRKPEKGLITKREVRAVSLARMQLTEGSIVWDIGAGSGSLGLEAARLCRNGHVYAIEKNTEDVGIAGHNARQLDIHNYTLVHARAPQALDQWVDPDAVFIGGSGGELAGLIEYCLQRMKLPGWLVMNFVTMENLAAAIDTLKKCRASWDVTQLQASRSQPILQMHRLKAENPVWIVSAQRVVE